jgi:hypothetical protein
LCCLRKLRHSAFKLWMLSFDGAYMLHVDRSIEDKKKPVLNALRSRLGSLDQLDANLVGNG